MKSIDNFKNKKIENLQDFYGGQTEPSYKLDTGKQYDSNTYNDAGCLVKHVENTGFWNWLTGNRTVTTYSWGSEGCNGIPHYNSDGSIAYVEWPTPTEDK